MMRYNKIRKMDISNGPGVRVSIFVQGCHFHCKDCFNPETWNFEGGKEFTSEILQKLIQLCEDDNIKGLSILGGEPLCDENFEEVKNIACIFKINAKTKNKDIWLWTGYEFEDIFKDEVKNKILLYVDYIVCGQFKTEQKNLKLKWAGSSNQRLIDVQKSLNENEVILKDM